MFSTPETSVHVLDKNLEISPLDCQLSVINYQSVICYQFVIKFIQDNKCQIL